MEFKPAAPSPAQPESKHPQQRILQIWLPVGLAVVVVLGGMVWTIVSATPAGPSLTKWADISAIWLILPLCLAGVLFLAFLALFIYLNARIYRGMPALDLKIQKVFFRIEEGVRRAADQSVKPIYSVRGWSASWKTLTDRLRGR